MTDRIFYTKPSITQLETDYAADAAATGWGARLPSTISTASARGSRSAGR
ncbi:MULTISPECIES: hypothetical protein [Rhizobium]|nr:hypothetical protein [Rhizobium leguminosarum]MBY2907128.1 hypothetical protein [Rhizobium leguminosarum]MBY2914030.1 hypothetical protein [Rhizobium leguminosarum]MBY2920103.1 hypothetical protein [Rhizobium leguminosarum]MBY2940415.1 hypothetical protein [Rhizobium leguminosarum]MBY2946394.1 hypothetical protein [Rhizobium leguminosarum]